MPFLPPNQQRQSTEGKITHTTPHTTAHTHKHSDEGLPVDGEVGGFSEQIVERVDHATVVDQSVDVLCQLLVIQQVQPAFTHRRVRLNNRQ